MVGPLVNQQIEKKNLICNFRAPNELHFKKWQDYKAWCQDNGKDVCHTTIQLIESFLAGIDGAKTKQLTIEGTKQVVNMSQENTFLYQVSKPRREPTFLSCAKEGFERTITSSMAEAYVLVKADNLKSSFCYRDFAELKHDSFRKIVLRLKKKGLVIAVPLRTNPRMYLLSKNLKHK